MIRKTLAAAVLAAAALTPMASADATTAGAVSVRLHPDRYCRGALTEYEVRVDNQKSHGIKVRAVEVRRGVKLTDRRYVAPARTEVGLVFYVESGRRTAVTIIAADGRVMLHKRLHGICY